MAKIGNSDLDVYGLNLGGNVFGWTADEEHSFAVLDAYAAAGGNFIDTADVYMARVPGNSGGESETIIGKWLAGRGRRDDVVIATKVGSWERQPGLSAVNIREAVEGSLRRLQTGHIDLYYAHRDVADVPLEETLGAFDELVRAGKVRYVALSNFNAERLAEALAVCDREGFARPVALQPHYNLVERAYEQDLAPLVQKEGLSTLPYFALAKGFLTGKYRSREAGNGGPRAEGAVAYLTGVSACWKRSTRSRRRTTPRRQRWRSRGWPCSRPSPRRSPAPATWSSWPTCWPRWSCGSPTPTWSRWPRRPRNRRQPGDAPYRRVVYCR
jgi:aryl-alcohol dehydrogenase-like predicted oxidoreductase